MVDTIASNKEAIPLTIKVILPKSIGLTYLFLLTILASKVNISKSYS